MFKNLSSLKKDSEYRENFDNLIDLDQIDRKICNGPYDSFYAFLVDIECIYHNCFVYYRGK